MSDDRSRLRETQEFLTIDEAASLIRRSKSAIRTYIRLTRNPLPVCRPGGGKGLLFPRDLLLEWVRDPEAACKRWRGERVDVLNRRHPGMDAADAHGLPAQGQSETQSEEVQEKE